jgi:hypothetical protein
MSGGGAIGTVREEVARGGSALGGDLDLLVGHALLPQLAMQRAFEIDMRAVAQRRIHHGIFELDRHLGAYLKRLHTDARADICMDTGRLGAVLLHHVEGVRHNPGYRAAPARMAGGHDACFGVGQEHRGAVGSKHRKVEIRCGSDERVAVWRVAGRIYHGNSASVYLLGGGQAAGHCAKSFAYAASVFSNTIRRIATARTYV